MRRYRLLVILRVRRRVRMFRTMMLRMSGEHGTRAATGPTARELVERLPGRIGKHRRERIEHGRRAGEHELQGSA